jgi:predicted LPLAT superfamily acyltransferase
VLEGFSRAAAQGFTHAVQIDADGQHDVGALGLLLRSGAEDPEALILGQPVYDASVPRARAFGRRFTNLWVWIETLSCRITDAMCGFRLYPLAPALAVADAAPLSQRMDFDIDIAVRMSWRGVRVRMLPVGVAYPAGNLSNFNMVRDNWRITRLHTRLVLGMLARLPALLVHRAAPHHWARLAERGAGWGLRLTAAAYRLGGRRLCLAMLFPVVAYFHATDAERRRATHRFRERAMARRGLRPRFGDGLRHALDFAAKAVEVAAAWSGDIRADRLEIVDPEALRRAALGGAVLIVSHLGNVEISRALLSPEHRRRLTVLQHTAHARRFNRMLAGLNPEAAMDCLEVSEIGPAAAIALQERVERGGWIAIAGDRTPPSGNSRVSRAPFLGAEASFPQGPYILAHLLRCPVYALFCLRDGARWRLHLEPFAERVELPAGDKRAALDALARRYAERLEAHAVAAPFQWYNFFEFWTEK